MELRSASLTCAASFHPTRLTSLQLFPTAALTSNARSGFGFVSPRHGAFGILSSHAGSFSRFSFQMSVYPPTILNGQLQYPKSGITHLYASLWRRVSTQAGNLPLGSSNLSLSEMLNSMLGIISRDAMMARCIECRSASARGTSYCLYRHLVSMM